MEDKNYRIDLSLISKELKLILEIIKTKNDDIIGLFKNELFSNIDWDIFLKLAKHHRIYPFIYGKLKSINDKIIPNYVIQTLYNDYKKNTFQMLQLSGEMEQVSELFTKNQIRTLFLKGPVIAADIYGDISLRTSKDLDILIPITNLEKAENLLLSLGYEKKRVPNVLNEWKWRSLHDTYYHSQKQIQIEIHWRLHPSPSKEPSFDELWERKRVSKITTYPVFFLGEEDLFLFLIAHGARHGWFRLRWLVDVNQMLNKGVEVEKINIFSKKYKYRHIVGQALILASQLFDTTINKEFKSLTRNHSKKLAQKSFFFINQMNEFEYPKDYLFSLKSTSNKFLSLLILIYPTYVDTEILRLPKRLHFLYFPLRPFLWVWRKTIKKAI
ncbi:nucleotidyltransferase family protein [Peribacillus frigoritolerans]|uniref:nucleotidyltransferase domain-containing protein n=1 Tax=Peribacillus frigoritolerans TaxID=450367 RepID=UPI0021D04C5E|nr:nucleotidyltransferase family protein [Peribacillus frigoritolerans]MCU6600470.1 nucleotidyltransferase family protein [Peribacillus frigoritolerans]